MVILEITILRYNSEFLVELFLHLDYWKTSYNTNLEIVLEESHIIYLGGVVLVEVEKITTRITNASGYPICALEKIKILSTCMLVKAQDYITKYQWKTKHPKLFTNGTQAEALR